MNDNDFLNSYKKNRDEEEDMFLEEPSQIEKVASQSSEQKTKRRTLAPKGQATRDNPTRQVAAPDENMTYEERNAFYSPNKYSQYAKGNASSGGGGGRNQRIIVVSLLSALLILCIIMLISFTGNVKVLDFTEWEKNDFLLWASENKINAQVEEKFDDFVEEGKIISQLVPAGEKVKKNQFVKVYVSAGPDMSVEYYLPDIMNMSKDEIDRWASENLMSKVRISVQTSDTIEKGKVISFQINDDTVIDKVKRDTPIYIIISRGSASETQALKEIKIPDFQTLGLAASMLFAQENGLVVTVNRQYNEYVAENTIISQSLSVDSIAHPGDLLTLVVSQGEMLIMPSFKQLEKGDAMSLAAQLGVPVKVKERYSSSDAGRMIYQSVAEGEQITDDTKLELTYSLGPKIAISNYEGQQKFIIEEWVESVNEYGARLELKVTYTQNSALAGTILSQNIKNQYIYRDTIIKIVVSTGNVVFVPDFVAVPGAGYDLAVTRKKAEDMAESLGLVLLFVEASDASRLPGEIWWQSIAAGAEVEVGTIITLKYNPVNVTLEVPDFTGMTVNQVKAMPEYNNLKIIFQLGETAPTGNVVYDQSVAAYSTVAYGAEIILYIYIQE
ncbi:MAG: PASTA domain-containing protein [Eubacteriales bacterium]